MAYEWQSDIIRPDGENGTEVLDTNGVYQPQIEGGDNITIEDGRINASGTLENVQADYTETDTSAPSYIKHKPDLSIYATASGMETALAGKQNTISDLATIRSGAEAGSTAVQPGDLAAVAFSGSYTSLSNTPQNIVQDANYVHSDNNFSNADKSKLDGIAAGAEVNVQSNWNETDPNSDAYIANKPTIPAAQQNADWNASSGVTAILNKPDLSAYATDSELADGLATKQNVISDLDSIRAGAAAGATAAQPSDLPSSDELVPSATSGDSGKVLTVDSQGNPGWVTPSAGTVYTPGDGIDITSDVISADVDGTTIGIDSTTKKIKSLQVIPTKTSDLQNDSNFVVASSLATVATSGNYSDLSGKPNIPAAQVNSDWNASSGVAQILNKPTIPSVDQTYSASSTNPQSGTAVAQAIASIPSSSYTAGDGIDITNNVISVDYGSTLTKDSGTVSGSFEAPVATLDTTSTSYTYSYAYGCGTPVTSDIAKLANNGGSATIAFSASGNNMFSISPNAPHVGIFFLYNKTDTEKCIVIKSSETVVTDMFGYYYYVPIMSGSSIALDFSDVVSYGGASLSDVSVGDWYIGFGAKGSNYECPTTTTNYWGGIYSTSGYVGVPANTLTGSYSGHLEVANPLPASAQADSGKVLKVNASGNAEWGTDSDTTYTAGNMIAINANNSNAIGVSTTAGITDIQVVNALPASPVATVLYMVPET